MRRKIIPYHPKLKERAKELRNNMTPGEVLLWNELKRKQLMGYDFDRQRPIDHFIVDFYCKDLLLAIEIDGDSHIGKEAYDAAREKRLNDLGVHILRFDDLEVRCNLDRVIKAIEDWIAKNSPPGSATSKSSPPGSTSRKSSPPGRGNRGGSGGTG